LIIGALYDADLDRNFSPFVSGFCSGCGSRHINAGSLVSQSVITG
jgi:hypothetical protein